MYRTFAFLITMFASAAMTSIAAPPAVRGHWRLDDGGGRRVRDSSGSGNEGLLKDAVWTPGVRKSGLYFNGKAQVNFGNDPTLCPDEALTIELWFKPRYIDYAGSPALVRKQGSYFFGFTPQKTLSIALTINGKQQVLATKTAEWANNEWVHAVAARDGDILRIYINGKLESEGKCGSTGISSSDSSLYLGQGFRGHIDEVRIAGCAYSPAEVKASFERGNYEIQRMAGNFAACFRKDRKRVPKAVVPGFLWIDTEDFDDYGGWWMDTQFVPQMGSPYLIAAGLGTPVADASTTVAVPQAGRYRLWVRTRNWLKAYSPGRFKIHVAGKPAANVFGTDPRDNWIWEDGGTFELPEGDTRIVLADVTGYYGRCDALILTTDLNYMPPNDQKQYNAERDRLTGVPTNVSTVGNFDVIVVGAGVAGCNAAIAAARNGAKTALIQDRPMLGGNNSLELGVSVSGPANWKKDNARASGLNEEINRERLHNFQVKWSQAAEVVAAREPNLKIFLNTHVNAVEMDGTTIKAVKAFNMIDGKLTRYTAAQFIDCTGDGWLGYYAGAEYMLGREGRGQFNEPNAPDSPDKITMSGCVMSGRVLSYAADDTGKPCPYTGPEWLWDLTSNTASLQKRPKYDTCYFRGKWWHENRGEVDDLWDPEAARDGLICLNLSYWNWIKNHSSLKAKAANRKLQIVPINNAKRETRRLVGDHILTQNDIISARPFPDRIGHGGWGLDIHHPKGIFSSEGPFDFNTPTPMYNIPYRILYSKNIANLLFAGRDVSVTHVALGTVRVQDTTGIMGQAAGTAAALCVRYNTSPRGIYQKHITDLQQQLLKDDQYIMNMKNEDPADIARSAKVTASSSRRGQTFSKDNAIASARFHELNYARAVMFKRDASPQVGSVFLLLKSTNKKPTNINLTVRGATRSGDYSSNNDIATSTATVPPGVSWVEFKVDCNVRDNYVWFMLPKTRGLFWGLLKAAPLGATRAYHRQRWMKAQGCYAFHLARPLNYPGNAGPENAINGVSRIVGGEQNMWISDPSQPMPQWIALDLGSSKRISAVYLTFDTDLHIVSYRGTNPPETERFVPRCVRNYKVLCKTGNTWTPVATVTDNYQRHRIHRFKSIDATAVKVVVEKTNGDRSARIFEIRVYNE